MKTEQVNIVEIWRGGVRENFYLKSDGLKFISGVNCGITGETYYEVGYSSPNLAVGMNDAFPELLELIRQKVDRFLEINTSVAEDDDTLILLLTLCQVANDEYNKWLCTPEWWQWKQKFDVGKG